MNRLLQFILFLSLALTATANHRTKFDREAYAKELRQFVIREAKLTQEEAKAFFVIYDEMRTKERELFSQKAKHKKKRPATEKECREAIIERDKLDIALKQIQQKYHLRMLKALPAATVMKALRQAEKFDQMKFRQMSREHNKAKKPLNNGRQTKREANK